MRDRCAQGRCPGPVAYVLEFVIPSASEVAFTGEALACRRHVDELRAATRPYAVTDYRRPAGERTGAERIGPGALPTRR